MAFDFRRGRCDGLIQPVELVLHRVPREESPRDAEPLVIHHQHFADRHAGRYGNPLKTFHVVSRVAQLPAARAEAANTARFLLLNLQPSAASMRMAGRGRTIGRLGRASREKRPRVPSVSCDASAVASRYGSKMLLINSVGETANRRDASRPRPLALRPSISRRQIKPRRAATATLAAQLDPRVPNSPSHVGRGQVARDSPRRAAVRRGHAATHQPLHPQPQVSASSVDLGILLWKTLFHKLRQSVDRFLGVGTNRLEYERRPLRRPQR